VRRHRSLDSLVSVQKVFCPDDTVRWAAHGEGRYATTPEGRMLTLLACLIRVGGALSPSLLRNVFCAIAVEAAELLIGGLLTGLVVYGALPLVLLWRVRVSPRTPMRAMVGRPSMLAAALALLVGAVSRLSQELSARMRNQKDFRYPIAPVNFVWSGVRVPAVDRRQAVKAHAVVGADVRFADSRAAWTGPLHFVA
jgi:lipid A ethanolaminephosphotransferase